MNEPINLNSMRSSGMDAPMTLLDSIFDKSNLLIAHMDACFNFIRVSKAYAEIDQKSVEFFQGKNHFALYPNEENELIFKKVVESGEPFHVSEKDFEYADHPERGTTIWDWSLIPIKDQHGVVQSLVLTLKNITQQVEAIKKLEEEMVKSKESEEKFRTMSEQSRVGIAIFQNNLLKYANKKLIEILEYGPEEIIKMSFQELFNIVHPEDRTIVIEQLKRKKSRSPDYLNQYRIRGITKKGEVIWIELFINSIKYEGKPADLISCIDITPNVISEQKLKESEEKFRTLSDHSMVGISIIQDGQMKYINQRLIEFVGYTRKEIQDFKNNDFIFLVHPDDRKRVMEITIRNQKGASTSTQHFELRLVKKNGQIRLLEMFARSIMFNGRPAGMNISIDITNKKKAELELKESEEKYRALFNDSPVGIFLFDDKYNFVMFNEELPKLIPEVFDHFLIGWNFVDMIKSFKNSDELMNIFTQRINKFSKGLKLEPVEIRAVMPSGQEKWFHWQSSKIQLHKKMLIQVVIQDITEKKEAERLIVEENKKLQELSKIRQELVTRISHELKTPITSIYGATQALLTAYRPLLSNKVLEFIEIINGGGNRLKLLVDSLIDIIHMQSNEFKLKLQDSNLCVLLKKCIRELYFIAIDRQITLAFDLPNEVILSIDKRRIEEVFKNILLNALYNTPRGGNIFIDIDDEENRVDVRIKDSGVGITETEKEKLFQEFGKIERYGKGYDVIIEGAGLGLYMSKEIVKKHGGQILVESEGRGKGATFVIRLYTTPEFKKNAANPLLSN